MNRFFIHTMARLTCLSALLSCAGANAAGAGPAGNPRVPAVLRQRHAELVAQQGQDQAALVSQMERLQCLERQLKQAARGIRTGRAGGALASGHTTAMRNMRAEIVRLQAALQDRAGRIIAINQQLAIRGAQPAVPVAPQVHAVARLARGELVQQRAYGAWQGMQTALTGNLGRLRNAVERVADAVAEAVRRMPQHELNQLLNGNVQRVRDAQAAADRAANPADAAAAARDAVNAASEAAAVAHAIVPEASERSFGLSGLFNDVASSIADVQEDARSVASSVGTVALRDPRAQGGAYAASSISGMSQASSAYSRSTVNLADPRNQAQSIAAIDQGPRSAASHAQSVPLLRRAQQDRRPFGRGAASVHSTGVFNPPASQASRRELSDAAINRWLDARPHAADVADPEPAEASNPPAPVDSQAAIRAARLRHLRPNAVASRVQAGPHAANVAGPEPEPSPAQNIAPAPAEALNPPAPVDSQAAMRAARLRSFLDNSALAPGAQVVHSARSVDSSRASDAGGPIVDGAASSHSAASSAGTPVFSGANAIAARDSRTHVRFSQQNNADDDLSASAAGSNWGDNFFGERR